MKKGIDISKNIVYNIIRREGTYESFRDGYARVAELVDALVSGSSGRPCRFKSCYPHQQKTHFCLSTKVRFLNDVCLRQMMLASPMMTASPNDAWLRHILWQTSHHCVTKWSNIILSEAKSIISPQAMHHLKIYKATP